MPKKNRRKVSLCKKRMVLGAAIALSGYGAPIAGATTSAAATTSATSARAISARAISARATSARAVTEPSPVLVNPVYPSDFPDPTVLAIAGVYHAYSTEVGATNIPTLTSTDLVHWTPGPDALPQLPTWAASGDTWAPTVTSVTSGGYVMFYAARSAATGGQCLGRATSASPDGPFVDSSSTPFVCYGAGGTIDASVFVDGAYSYLFWKELNSQGGHQPGIWVQQLGPGDATLVGSPQYVLGADQMWEGGIVEGPAMIKVGSTYQLFFAGNVWHSASYAIGEATCKTPLGPCVDTSPSPVLSTPPVGSGPGGPDFFKTTAGRSVMSYAAWPSTVTYAAGGIRALYLSYASFAAGVIPVFSDGSTPLVPPPPVPPPPVVSNAGYFTTTSTGQVFAHGNVALSGSPQNSQLNKPIVTMATDPATGGYWLAATDGGVFSYNAPFLGSAGSLVLNKPIVGMARTPDGNGYWLVASDGGVFSYGDANFYGSTGAEHLNQPVVGMAATPDGKGYWLVASDGGIFAFGDAQFLGSMGGSHLNEPVVGMAGDPVTGGYWLVASDGGIFSFGAPFLGSTGAEHLNKPIVAMSTVGTGDGYRFVASDGGVFSFGSATFYGSEGGHPPGAPEVAMAALG